MAESKIQTKPNKPLLKARLGRWLKVGMDGVVLASVCALCIYTLKPINAFLGPLLIGFWALFAIALAIDVYVRTSPNLNFRRKILILTVWASLVMIMFVLMMAGYGIVDTILGALCFFAFGVDALLYLN
jgi:hypothetical protein